MNITNVRIKLSVKVITVFFCSLVFTSGTMAITGIDVFPYSQDFEAMATCGTGAGTACVLTPTDGWFNNTSDDDIDWTVDVAGTASNPTGPSVDHSIGDNTGKYLYTESSDSAGNPDSLALLESPFFNFSELSEPVVSFWYHMYGDDQGTMHFDVDPLGNGNWVNDVIPAWTDDLDEWQQQNVDLSEWAGNTLIKFRIRGITGLNFLSDMAIDDVVVGNRISNFPYTQDFEAMATCGTGAGNACALTPTDGWFNNTADDDVDWTVDVDGTASSPTGPSVDHSIGDSTGKYLYIESSDSAGNPDSLALLESPSFDFSELSEPVVSFWYHMYGATQGTMHFDVDPLGDGNWVDDVIPSWTDDLNVWQQQKINLSQYAGNSFFRFRIRGITGSSFTGDMAIDDFEVKDDDGFCVPIKIQNGAVAVICL